MSQSIPPPNYRNLLPPLLACLPTAFASPRPPPALFPLLSPILRQRVQMLAATGSSSTDSWLPLLCWESVRAERLVSIVESGAFEIHPASGEIDFGDIQAIQYKRFDEETLRANLSLADLGLSVTYLWHPTDQEGDESGWLVSEVSPIEEQDHNLAGWSSSIREANDMAEKLRADSLQNGAGPGLKARSMQGNEHNGQNATPDDREEDDEDEESYWAQYAATPGRSPGQKTSLLEIEGSKREDHQASTSDAQYYARYAHVQPEMDDNDPSEHHGTLGEFTLNGDAIYSPLKHTVAFNQARQPAQVSKFAEAGMNCEVKYRRLSSPSSRSTAVSRLEDSAVAQSASEVAIRQHVGNTIKSLFRLARGAGLDREEFNDLVRRELDILSLIAEDD